ncbi:3556_t:CDS:2, partial [Cetraspora pellucida]
FPLCLAWAITIHKSQDLILPQAVINLENKEFKTGLTFIAKIRAKYMFTAKINGRTQ